MSLTDKAPHETRAALESVFLVTNAFVWLFYSIYFLDINISKVSNDYSQVQLLWVIYFGALITSLVVGALLVNRVGRRTLFLLWTSMGVVSPFALVVFNSVKVPVAMLLLVLFAFSAGLGMPNCMEYLTRSIRTEKRGHYAGFVILFSVLGLFLLRVIGGGIDLIALSLSIWRLAGLIGLYVAKSVKTPQEKPMRISYRSLVTQRSFILYLLPWIMFSSVNFLTQPVQISLIGKNMFTELQLVENIIGLAAAIPAGFLMDIIGRKQAAIGGFVLLGVGYSVLGLYPTNMNSWYFYTVFDGISWGLLSVLFVVCIWGELNQTAPSDKYYAIGVVPFFISESISLVFNNNISIDISPYAIFSFTAFFLFIAVLPLVYAPETLPEKILKERDLKSYAEKALKKASKESEKHKSKPDKQKEKNDAGKGESDESSEYEEARKLAEKYY